MEVDVEVDAEVVQRLLDLLEHQVHAARAEDLLRVGLLQHVGDLRGDPLGDLGDVGPAVPVLGGGLALRRGEQGPGEPVDLGAVVVEVVLPRDLRAGGLEQPGERVADRGPADAPDVDRAGRVGADELEVDALPGRGVVPAVRRTGGQDLGDDLAEGLTGEPDVEEPRAGDLDASTPSTCSSRARRAARPPAGAGQRPWPGSARRWSRSRRGLGSWAARHHLVRNRHAQLSVVHTGSNGARTACWSSSGVTLRGYRGLFHLLSARRTSPGTLDGPHLDGQAPRQQRRPGRSRARSPWRKAAPVKKPFPTGMVAGGAVVSCSGRHPVLRREEHQRRRHDQPEVRPDPDLRAAETSDLTRNHVAGKHISYPDQTTTPPDGGDHNDVPSRARCTPPPSLPSTPSTRSSTAPCGSPTSPGLRPTRSRSSRSSSTVTPTGC